MLGRRSLSLLAVFGLVGAGVAAGIAGAAAAGPCAAPPPMTFADQKIIDATRAGGEPMIQTHPNGTLMYGSHAGTTHFFTPTVADPSSAAFGQNYKGQTYFWYSEDNGDTWTFVDRTLPPDNDPMSGFSDPDFAIDTAGNVYLSEINLVNVAVSKSTNVSEGFKLQNFFGQFLSDRQWKEADTEDLLYMVGNVQAGAGTMPPANGGGGHILFRSTDGGATWDAGTPDPGGLGDLRVDKSDGTLYEAHFSNGSELSMVSFPNARSGDLTPVESLITDDVHFLAHWPSFDLDPKGNLYITWDEDGLGERAAGIWYAYSTTKGRTWSKPIPVALGEGTKIWPWLAVGDEGRVGVAWFQADTDLPDANASTAGTHNWYVYAAQSINGLGCASSPDAGFAVSQATKTPVHQGTICQAGTVCQATATDRRLGDYFATEIDSSGAFVAAYSDTSQGGSVSLPGFVRQSGGASYFGKAAAAPVAPTQPKPAQPKPAQPKPATPLPSTGINGAIGALAMLAVAGGAYAVRRRTG